MITERFITHHDGFDLLDLRAHFEFKSMASIGFQIGPIPKGRLAYTVFGFLQIHHPCSDHIQVRIYVQLPHRYAEPPFLRQFCEALLVELGIPADETYELHFTDSSSGVSVEQRINREGFVDAV